MKNNLHFCIILLFIFCFSLQNIAASIKVQVSDKYGTADTVVVDCDYDRNVELYATFDSIYGISSNSYSLSSVPYNYINSATWTNYNISGFDQNNAVKMQDVFGSTLSLPFNFCFFGRNYSSIIISDNGVVSFNTANAQSDCPFIVNGTINGGLLPKNSIFGVFHDMINDVTVQKVKIATLGVAPYRQFVIFFDDLRQSGSSQLSSSQIILYESTNIIDVQVKQKTQIGNKATIGIVNDAGTLGYAPTSRDGTNWGAANEGWRFSPNGTFSATIRWYQIGSSSVLSYANPFVITNPNANRTYRAELTYNNGCHNIISSDTIVLKLNKGYTIVSRIDSVICVDAGEVVPPINLTDFNDKLVTSSGSGMSFDYSYHTTNNNANNNTSRIDTSVPYPYASDNMTLYVRVGSGLNCYQIATLNFKVNRKPLLNENDTIRICDVNNNWQAKFNLRDSLVAHYSINSSRFYAYTNRTDAENNTGRITNTTSFSINSSSSVDSVFFRAWGNDASCYNIYKTIIEYLPYTQSDTIVELICGSNIGDSVIVDLVNIMSGYGNLKYYANSNLTSEIQNPSAARIKLNTVIYAKPTDNNCMGTHLITVLADENCDDMPDDGGAGGGGGGAGGGGGIPLFCDIENDTIMVNLYYQYLNYLLPEDVNISHLANISFRFQGGAQIEKPDSFYIILDPFYNKRICASYTIIATNTAGQICFDVKASKAVEISNDSLIFNICDVYNDGKENIDLTIYNEFFTSFYGPGLVVKYFKTIADRDEFMFNSIMSDINTFELNNPTQNIFIYLEYLGCTYTGTMTFHLLPIVQRDFDITVCDFNDDDAEIINLLDYKNNILNDLIVTPIAADEILSLTFYNTLNSAYAQSADSLTIEQLSNYSVSSTTEVYAHAEMLDTCPIIYTIKFEMTTAVALPIVRDTTICDLFNDGHETFDLFLLIDTVFAGSRVDIYSENVDNINPDTNYYLQTYTDGATFNYEFSYQDSTLFIHVYDSITGCSKVIPIKVKLIAFPKIANDTITLCDFLNDQTETVGKDLASAQLIANNSTLLSTFEYTFHLTKLDAMNENNELTDITVSTNSKIWVRIFNGVCFEIDSLIFKFEVSPILQTPQLYYICNNNTLNNNNVVNESVNLNLFCDQLGLNDPLDYTYAFYKTYQNALLGTSAVNSNYAVTNFPDTVYVSVTNAQGCFSIDTIRIDQFSYVDSLLLDKYFVVCSDGELNVNIDLSIYAEEMLKTPYTMNDFDVSYHASKAYAISGVNITNINNYSFTPQSAVWIKYKDKTTGCYYLKQLNAVINSKPKSTDVEIEVCDESDGVLDGYYTINFDSYKAQIIEGEPNIDQLYTFSYYSSMADADSKINAYEPPYRLNSDDFQNLIDTVFVRADRSDGAGCSNFSKIIVRTQRKPSVILNRISVASACDGVENDGNVLFTLPVTTDISDEPMSSIAYFTSLANAQSGQSALTSSGYTTTSTFDSLYIRVSAPLLCDTLVKMHFIIYPAYETNKDTIVCPSELPFQYGDSIFAQGLSSGVYPVTFKTINGCDSVMYLSVTVLPTDTIVLKPSICAGDVYQDYNFNIPTELSTTKNIVLYDSILSANIWGCDSLTKIELTVLSVDSIFITDTICAGELYNDNGFYIQTEAQLYAQILNNKTFGTNVLGCDSTTLLSLLVTPEITFNVDTDPFRYRQNGLYGIIDITNLSQSEYRYTIIKTDDNSILYENATNLTYQVFESGYFKIIVTDKFNCSKEITVFVDRVCPDIFAADMDLSICADNFSFDVPYVSYDGYPEFYSIEFSESAIQQGFTNIPYTPITDASIANQISIQMPVKEKENYVRPNRYSAKLLMRNNACAEITDTINFEFTVFYPSWIIEQKWNDVIALLNDKYNGGYLFSSYNWYRNGQSLPLERHSYLYIGAGNHLMDYGDNFHIMLTRADDGISLPCCPIIPENRTDIYSNSVYVDNSGVIIVKSKSKGIAKLWTPTGAYLGTYPITNEVSTIVPPRIANYYMLEIRFEDGNMSTYKLQP